MTGNNDNENEKNTFNNSEIRKIEQIFEIDLTTMAIKRNQRATLRAASPFPPSMPAVAAPKAATLQR